MKKEDLIAMGFSEEQADALVNKYGNMVPLERFNEVNGAKKSLEEQVKTHETQLKDLQGKAKGNEELQAEITKLQESQKQAKEQYEQQLKDERMSTALKLAIANKVHDVDLVTGLVDKSKIELDDKGNVKAGLDEQLKTLQESKSFLFVPEKEEKKPEFKGWSPAGGNNDKDGELDLGSMYAKQQNEKGVADPSTPSRWT
ncbi:phage scaffolding protein [Solibacillus sp. A46]|uniref:Phage scaffolding protein n=1 Tax=Solibacillus faecavium TaxID=2762221 RepID=A0ABR8XYT7_9BACL|nr:phage scaffolding protein [Solibacillus faecavium]MBD8037098.1 phage scaffolding protein [Solibacillus faecavium]